MTMTSPIDQENQRYVIQRPLGERVSALEVHVETMLPMMADISTKLDDLLELKAKGMGAISFVSILVASVSGLAGVIAVVLGMFNGKQ